MDRKMIDEVMMSALRNVKGIVNSCPLPNEDYPRILEKELEAEEAIADGTRESCEHRRKRNFKP